MEASLRGRQLSDLLQVCTVTAVLMWCRVEVAVSEGNGLNRSGTSRS